MCTYQRVPISPHVQSYAFISSKRSKKARGGNRGLAIQSDCLEVELRAKLNYARSTYAAVLAVVFTPAGVLADRAVRNVSCSFRSIPASTQRRAVVLVLEVRVIEGVEPF